MVFEKANISSIELNNRILRSATNECLADTSGFPSEKLIKKYIQLAQGGVGAIITGYAGINQNGKGATSNMLMIDNDTCIPYYKRLTDSIHEHRTSIILQIAHCGRQTRSVVTSLKPVAPSAIKDKYFNEELPFELSETEILNIIDDFVEAIRRAKESGFDGVQLHAAHGYLLAQFLSNHSNSRKDRWGGSIENRFRIISQIYDKAKIKVGNFPILVKINATDGQKNGMRINEAIEISRLLEKQGCAGIEVSCGTYEDGLYTVRGEVPIVAAVRFNFKYKKLPSLVKNIMTFLAPKVVPKIRPFDNYNVELSSQIKQNVTVPVIVVGGIHSISGINDVINGNKADFVSMCRPFIIEPNIVNKFKSGLQLFSKCTKCNFCLMAQEEKPLTCYNNKL